MKINRKISGSLIFFCILLPLCVAFSHFTSINSQCQALPSARALETPIPLEVATYLDWNPQITQSVGTSPYSVAVGDANNDGQNEILVANVNAASVSILTWNRTRGTWNPQITRPVDIAPFAVAIGDANNDGQNDFVTANLIFDTVSIYLWNCTAGTWNAAIKRAVTGGDGVSRICIGDANNDGQNDLVTSNAYNSTISILLWNSTARTWNAPITRTVGTSPQGLFLGDANNDGQNDLVTCDLSENAVSILLWNITTATWDAPIALSTWSAPAGVYIGDANNDGQNDIVAANANSDSVSILTWNTVTWTWNAQTWRTVGDEPRSVFIGDANNDGQNDIVTANFNAGTVSILTWNIITGNWNAQITRAVGAGVRSVYIGDANNDGQNDIVTANYNANNISILTWNTLVGTWNTPISCTVGDAPYSTCIGDANNDGQNDIVTANANAASVSILTWDRMARTWNAQITRNVGAGPQGVFIGDANNDGQNDLVTANYYGDTISILMWNHTTGTWNDQITRSAGDGPYGIYIGDANNDGRNDLVTTNYLANNISILTWNDTTGTWNAPIFYTVGDYPISVSIADANNDGQNEIVSANAGVTFVSILTWNRTVGTWNAPVARSVSNAPSSVFIGDANNDGQKDIVTASASSSTISILTWNIITGTWNGPNVRAMASQPYSVFIGDANNDGQNDIVTANLNADNVSILTWNAIAGTWNTPIMWPVGDGPRSIFIGDANNDGQKDLVTANTNADTVSILTWPRIIRPTLNPISPNLSNSVIKLNWSEIAPKYYIYRANFSITTIAGLAPIGMTLNTNYTDVISQDGGYYYVIIATDGFTNSSISNCQSVEVDLTPPHSTNFQFPLTETRTSGNITIEMTDEHGVSSVLLLINNSDFGSQNQTMQFDGENYWYTYTPLSLGCRLVTFYMNDTLGNWNSSQYFINNIYFAPPYSYNFNFPSTETRATSNITLQVADNVDVSQVLLYINNTDFGTQNRTMYFDGTHYWYAYTPLSLGCRLVTFYMNDTVNNWNYSVDQINNVFSSPPTYTGLSYLSSMAFGVPTEINLYGVADNTLVQTVNISLNGLQNATMLPLGGNRYRYTFTPQDSRGNQFFAIYLIDDLGNVIIINRSISVVVDEEKPTYTQLTAPNVIQGTMMTISINVSDNTAVKEVSLYISGADFPLPGIPMTLVGNGVYEYSFMPTILGNRTFTISAEDIAGNMAYVMGYFTVSVADEEKPTYTQLMDPNVVQGTMMTISINASDNTGIREVCLYISGADFPLPGIPMTLVGNGVYEYSFMPTILGNRTFTISMEDIAGNMAYVMGYFTVSVADEEKPTYNQLIAPSVVQGTMMTISINVSDNTGIREVCLYISGVDFPLPGIPMTLVGNGVYRYSFLPTIIGNRTFTISMEDIAGNMAYVSGSFTITALPTGDGESNPALDFFLNYLLAPLLAGLISALIVAFLVRSHYTKKLETKISELETALKTISKAQSKTDKGS